MTGDDRSTLNRANPYVYHSRASHLWEACWWACFTERNVPLWRELTTLGKHGQAAITAQDLEIAGRNAATCLAAARLCPPHSSRLTY